MMSHASALLDRAVSLLRSRWGYREFRPGQWEVIEHVLKARDVLGVLPTGSGKSICYQLPGLMTRGVVVVVSPLIALMTDQVQSLQARSISGIAINSALPRLEKRRAWTSVRNGRFKFVYVSPELLQSERFVRLMSELEIAFVAVDEAHCIDEWGRNFRPAYRNISQAIPDSVSRVALTATATPAVRREIVKVLRLRSPAQIVTGYDRPNIVWSTTKVLAMTPVLARLLATVRGSAVVYCMTRNAVEWWAHWLSSRGIPTSYYHGGLERESRAREQSDWLLSRTRVMVATNAFGMGIDKPDVRVVIHIGLPANLSAYYQEAGRAGRDGLPARATLLYQPSDVLVRKRLLGNAASAHRETRSTKAGQSSARRFHDLMHYVRSPVCRRRYLLNYFGEAYGRDCSRCDRCHSSSIEGGHLRFETADVTAMLKHEAVDAEALVNRPRTGGLQREQLDRMIKEGLAQYSSDLSTIRLGAAVCR